MLSEKIVSIQATLGELAGRVSKEEWAVLSMARENLKALAERAEQLEKNFTVEAA